MFSNCSIGRSSSRADSIQMVNCSFHFSFGIGLRKKLFLAETGWHRYREEIFFLINKMNSFEYPKRELPYKKNECVRRTFWGWKGSCGTSYGVVTSAATGKFQNETKQNELWACRDKLVGGTTLQVVFKGRQVNHGKPKLTVIGDLSHQHKRS